MSANTNPIFTLTPDIQWSAAAITAANTAKDGTGTVTTVFTADATNGGYIVRLRFRAIGTNITSLARVFINNGSSNATPANNTLWDEVTLPATTLSEVAALQLYELPMAFALPAGYKINVVLATAVAAGYQVTVIGGKYS